MVACWRGQCRRCLLSITDDVLLFLPRSFCCTRCWTFSNKRERQFEQLFMGILIILLSPIEVAVRRHQVFCGCKTCPPPTTTCTGGPACLPLNRLKCSFTDVDWWPSPCKNVGAAALKCCSRHGLEVKRVNVATRARDTAYPCMSTLSRCTIPLGYNPALRPSSTTTAKPTVWYN